VSWNNGDRADRAWWALAAYLGDEYRRKQEVDQAMQDPSDPDNKAALDEVVGDLLCDLQHWADRYRLDWDQLVDRARDGHDIEVAEERQP
jgi:hypothetical protein